MQNIEQIYTCSTLIFFPIAIDKYIMCTTRQQIAVITLKLNILHTVG